MRAPVIFRRSAKSAPPRPAPRRLLGVLDPARSAMPRARLVF